MATRLETRRRQGQRASNEDRSHAAARNVDTGSVTVSSNSGEAILRFGRREISILVARKEVTITHARYAAGEQVAGPHVRTRTVDPLLTMEFRSVTRIHARSLATQFLLQIEPNETSKMRREASRVSVLCPRAVVGFDNYARGDAGLRPLA
jgi:hypothetical protein